MIQCHGAVVHPGFVEAHIHVTYLIWRWGFPDASAWPDYLGFHSKYWDAISGDDEYAASRLACLEMARNGTTCYLDAGSVLEPDAAATATEAVGMRGLLGDPHVGDLKAPAGPTMRRIEFDRGPAFESLGGQLKRNANADALVRGHVALRGIAHVSDDLLLAAKELADENDVVLNMHQSYNEYDVSDDDRRLGCHPLVHYAEIGALGENCTFSLMNILRDDEVKPVTESGMSVVWSPSASMLLAVGATFRGRHAELYRQGVNVALASDSSNSSGSYDVADQAYLALLTAREKTPGSTDSVPGGRT